MSEEKDFSLLEREINYVFKDKSLLTVALTHSSYCNENRKRGFSVSNERSEFLGDSILSIITAEYLYHRFPESDEGFLTRTRAALVCEDTLAVFANSLSLGDYMLFGKGEAVSSGGRHRKSTVSDAFEALIAAIYIDGGMEPAAKHILNFVIPSIKNSRKKKVKDYKTTLQEIVQKNPGEKLEYVLIGESGPDHNKHFVVEVHLNSNVIGKGGGRSKKEAEQQAAREALELMGY